MNDQLSELCTSADEIFEPSGYAASADMALPSVEDILAKVGQLAEWAGAVAKSLPPELKSMIRTAAIGAFDKFAAPKLGPFSERIARGWLISQLDAILGS